MQWKEIKNKKDRKMATVSCNVWQSSGGRYSDCPSLFAWNYYYESYRPLGLNKWVHWLTATTAYLLSYITLSLYFCILYTLLSQWEFVISPPREIRVAFPQGKPAATESLYPTLINYKVHAGSFCVSMIHQTLTWTTGSLTVRTWSFLCVRI